MCHLKQPFNMTLVVSFGKTQVYLFHKVVLRMTTLATTKMQFKRFCHVVALITHTCSTILVLFGEFVLIIFQRNHV